MLRVAIVAGEPSGDLLAAGLLRAISARVATAAEGIAGPRMIEAGCRAWDGIERLAVMGLPEIIRRYPELRRLQRQTIERIIAMRPDVCIGVDAPEFNLGIEKAVRAAGIRTVHYVSPSVWAWREGRLRTIRAGVDLMLTLFPFEARYYEQRDIPVCFVGHPLVEELARVATRDECRASLGLDAGARVVAVLPGSRGSELRYHAEPFIAAVARCARQVRGLCAIVPVLDERAAAVMRGAAQRLDVDVRIVIGRAREVLRAADAGLIASGTATLEALLLGCPMVVAYRVHWLSYGLIRPLIRIDRFALPNLLAGRAIVPERIQREATPASLAAALLPLLEDTGAADAQREAFRSVRGQFGLGASERAAQAVLKLLGRLGDNPAS